MISTKGRYAVRMLIDLCEQGTRSPATLRDVARRQEVSEKYLQHIAKDLVSAGLVVGASGRGGGYRLARSACDISVLQVLEATEGTLAPVSCLAPGAPACPRAPQCKTLPMWERYRDLVQDFFGSISIESLRTGTFDENVRIHAADGPLDLSPLDDTGGMLASPLC